MKERKKIGDVLLIVFLVIAGIVVLASIGYVIHGLYVRAVGRESSYVWGPVTNKYTEIRESSSGPYRISSKHYTYYLDVDVTDDSETLGTDDRGDGSDVVKVQVTKSVYDEVVIGDFAIVDTANGKMDFVSTDEWESYTRAEMEDLVEKSYK